MVLLNGLMEMFMKDSLKVIISRDMVDIYGQMGGNMKDFGGITR